jgi:uncharacterized protein (DUF1015 family)
VKDPTVVKSPDFLEKVKQFFDIIPSGNLPVQPLNKGEFGIYFQQKAYLLKLRPGIKATLQGVLDQLDVSIVERFILQKVFQINDSKTDNRLSFMDGVKGIGHLQIAVDSGDYDLAISLYPTAIDEVKAVADQHLIMPPKSTWIEPKIRTGLLIMEHQEIEFN